LSTCGVDPVGYAGDSITVIDLTGEEPGGLDVVSKEG
jgi:hypothetical protein